MHWDINTWINFAAFIAFPLIGAVYVHVRSVATSELAERDKRIDTVRAQAVGAIEAVRISGTAQLEAAETKLSTLGKAFYDYKVEVSEKYATTAYLRDVETRITQRFDAIDKKLDRLIERNQRRDTDT